MLPSFLRPLQSPPILASIAAGALFIGTLAWWGWAFHTPPRSPLAALPQPAAIDASAGATLFGAQPERSQHDQVQLLGILAFDASHAAAIVSVGGDAAQVVRVNGTLAESTTLSAVHPHSIVIDHRGVRHEIALPAAPTPDAYVR